MFNKILIVCAATFFVLGCRKQEPAELPINGEIVEATCSNGIMDANEDGIDCGSNCVPCNLSVPDCSGDYPTNNTLQLINGSNFTIDPETVTFSNSTGKLIVMGYTGTSYLKITFGTLNPVVFSSYPVTQGFLNSDEVKFEFTTVSGSFIGYSSEVHLNRMNGKLTVEFCNVYVTIPSGGYDIAKGKLTEY